MIIACVACSTRYVVPNAKIVGRKVRTVCKRCGAALTVDGTKDPPTIIAENVESVQRLREEYMVAFSASQKEKLTVRRIVELYAAGEISTATHAWREGMERWLTLFEIDVIATELRAAGYLPVIGAQLREEDEDATRVARHVPSQAPLDDEDMTRVARRPAPSGAPEAEPTVSVSPEDQAVPSVVPKGEEDDATQVFRPDQMREQLEEALRMGENADSVTKVAAAARSVPPDLPPEVPQARPPSVPPPRRISMPPVAIPVAEMLLEPTSTISVSNTMLIKPRRRKNSLLWACVVLTLAAAVVLVVLYVTGRWPLVTRATADFGERVLSVAQR
jgi:hypothetical protein